MANVCNISFLFQISPIELEEVILSLPEVQDVGILGVPHETEQYRLLALVVKKENTAITEQAIIDYVASTILSVKLLNISFNLQFSFQIK